MLTCPDLNLVSSVPMELASCKVSPDCIPFLPVKLRQAARPCAKMFLAHNLTTYDNIPVVPHKAVAEVPKIGNR